MDLALRLQAFLAAIAAPRKELVRVPPFTAYLDLSDALKYHSYAIPDTGAGGGLGAAVDSLRAVFRERDRLPRLEYVAECAPDLAAALAAAGMVEELDTPVMGCTPVQLERAEVEIDDLAIEPIRDHDLRPWTSVQRVAFGEEPLAADEPVRDYRPHGERVVVARIGDLVVAGGSASPVVDGVSEIRGVATGARWRRRGLAGAVTAAAAREAFAAGAELCILTPGDEASQRVYARAGFRRIATAAYWSDPE